MHSPDRSLGAVYPRQLVYHWHVAVCVCERQKEEKNEKRRGKYLQPTNRALVVLTHQSPQAVARGKYLLSAIYVKYYFPSPGRPILSRHGIHRDV